MFQCNKKHSQNINNNNNNNNNNIIIANEVGSNVTTSSRFTHLHNCPQV